MSEEERERERRRSRSGLSFIKTDELLTSDHHIDIHSEFFVDAKIVGQ
ncbi:MAG: hypothetical protein ACKO6A_09085 [Bacteroidota bacterium]